MAEPFHFAGCWYALYRDHQGATRIRRARTKAQADQLARQLERHERRAARLLRKHIKERRHG